MYCPVCSETSLVMSDRQGIEIDYCPKCRGVWLDRGELDKIIDRSSAVVSESATQRHSTAKHSQPSHYPENNQGYRGDYRHKKRHGFLSDIFDFD